jgi:hypothetical protein
MRSAVDQPAASQGDGEPLLDEAVLGQVESLDGDVLSSISPLYSLQAAGASPSSASPSILGNGEYRAGGAQASGTSGPAGARQVSRPAGALETSAREGNLRLVRAEGRAAEESLRAGNACPSGLASAQSGVTMTQ